MRRPLLLLLCAAVLTAADAPGAADVDAAWVTVIDRAAPAFVVIAGGSGVVISADGLMLTNHHVIDEDYGRGRLDLRVRVDGRMRPARVLGTDPAGDIALLRIDASGEPLPHVEFGDSSALVIGQQVLALGNPFGAAGPIGDPTATIGVISALNRFNGGYNDAIQTDAPVNPGNSGGPLLTLDGRLVGINGQIQTRHGGRANTGIGLAVPANQIRRFLPLLAQADGGLVWHGRLSGLVGDGEEADGLRNGAELSEVRTGSRAAAIGLRAGDRVTAVDGQRCDHFGRLLGLLGTYPAGSRVALTVVRGAETITAHAELERMDPGAWGFDLERPQDREALAEMLARLRRDFTAKMPVRIASVDARSPAAAAGLRVGDLLLRIADQPVHNPVFFERIARRIAGEDRMWAGTTLPVVVEREGREVAIDLVLDSQWEALRRAAAKR